MKSSFIWIGLICFVILTLAFMGWYHTASAQTRDEETAKEVEKINPLTPAAQATKAVIDNTVNQVSPIKVPTESKLVQDEKSCYDSCTQQRDSLLKASANVMERGQAWSNYNKCKKLCPEKVANKNRGTSSDPFSKEDRYPAGSTMGR